LGGQSSKPQRHADTISVANKSPCFLLHKRMGRSCQWLTPPGMHSVPAMSLVVQRETASALQKCRKWTRLWFSQVVPSRKSPLTRSLPLLCSYTLSFMGEPFEVTLKHELVCLKICLLIWHQEIMLSWCNVVPTTSFQRQISSLSKLKSKNQLQKSAGGMLVLAIRAQEP
jgi:hypothetical protein